MKNLREKTKQLVKQILNEDLLTANNTLASLILEAQQERQNDVADSLNDEAGDDEAVDDGETEDLGDQDSLDDQPSNGSPNLGDSLDNSVQDTASQEDQMVDQGQMTQMSNDIVQINCQVNQKVIGMLYDKISNLKTTLNELDMDHSSRQFITLETKLSYYGNKLEELQSKTNPAIDQSKVQQRIEIIDQALKSLESEIGSNNDVDDVESSDQIQADENTEQIGAEQDLDSEVDEVQSNDEQTQEQAEQTVQDQSSSDKNGQQLS